MITLTTWRFWGFVYSIVFVLWKRKRLQKWQFIPLLIIIAGFIIPQKMVIPVTGASQND
jgi:hypothetical protein